MLIGHRGAAVTVAGLVLATFASPGQAVADGPGGEAGSCGLYVCVEAGTPGKPGSSGGNQPVGDTNDGKGSGGSVKPPECTPAKKLDPQPPASSDLWDGHDPADGGAVYVRTCRYYMTTGASTTITEAVYGGPGGPPEPAVDPAVVAQQAVDKMLLRGPEIGITPKPGGTGVIGMPVYMWTSTGAETYGPNSATATAGAVSVTATAKVSRIVWNMGDGHSVVCTTAGTPYKAAYGKQPSPDCGHRYTRPSSAQTSGKYHVTATSTWTIDWAGGGATGQLTEVRNSAVDIAVAEVQVVN